MIEIQYAAGFIDADGTIYAIKNDDGTVCNWRVEASQSEKNGIHMLHSMQQRWGGSVKCNRPGDNPQWSWTASGLNAAVALQDMLPYFIVKKIRAEIALALLWKKNERIMKRVFP